VLRKLRILLFIGLVVGFFTSLSVSAAQRKPGLFYTQDKQDQLQLIQNPFSLQAAKRLNYYGGPVLGHAKIVVVFWGGDVNSTTQSSIGGFIRAIVDSTYMDLFAQYDTNINALDGRSGTQQRIERGVFGGQFLIQPRNSKRDIDDSEIGIELSQQIDAGVLPKPDADTVFLIYYPPNFSITVDGSKSCEVFCGYHHNFTSQVYGDVYYSVIPDLEGACSYGCQFALTPFQNLSVTTSHEIAEAITDPDVHLGGVAYPVAWATANGEEIGDLCASDIANLFLADGSSYVVQQEFDNSTRKCAPGPFRSR